MAFFFFGVYPTGERRPGQMLVELKGNCLCPQELPDFQAAFLQLRDQFEGTGGFGSRTTHEDAIDTGELPVIGEGNA